jgi:uncharacterized protein (TIGR02118 family)
MIAVFSLIRRKDGVDTAAFRAHWLDPHGVLVCRFPGLRRYSQNRVAAARSPAAEALKIDGIAELVYETDADQEVATNSPEMAACDVDSPGFIGSVVRIVSDIEDVVGPPSGSGLPKLILLISPQDSALCRQPEFDSAIRSLPGLAGYLRNITRVQRGPKSKMPVLDFPVGTVIELWFESEMTLDRAAVALRPHWGVDTASFAIDEVRLV